MRHLNLRLLFSISLFLLTYSTGFAQSERVKKTYYYYGQIQTRDSLLPGDTIRIIEYYDETPDSISGDTTYFSPDTASRLYRRKKLRLSKNGSWEDYGIEIYWYDNGQKRYEMIMSSKPEEIRYVNFWTREGKQTLTSGNGHVYETWPDSTVYEVHDSIMQGSYQTWSKLNDSKTYYLSETGQMRMNRKYGLQVRYDPDGGINHIYENRGRDSLNLHQYYYPEGTLKEAGYKISYAPEGHWRYWDENGMLKNECNYVGGRLIGEYREYYSNGWKKVVGQYVHISGKDTITVQTDPSDPFKYEKEVIDRDDIPAKDGWWEYYSEEGKLIRRELYRKGKLKKTVTE